mgnify:CR=1 FL=1
MRFEDLVRRHAAELYRYAFWLARDRQRAEDVVQEALLRAWRGYPRLRDPNAAKAWLFSIVRNEHYRAAGKHPPLGEVIELHEVAAPEESQDLYGLEAVGLPDRRPWLDHGRWGVGHPLGAAVPRPARRAFRMGPRCA